MKQFIIKTSFNFLNNDKINAYKMGKNIRMSPTMMKNEDTSQLNRLV